MRELIIIIFISCQLFVFANSAPTGSISGVVIDSITKEKIEYVSVSLKKNGKIISGVLTDKKGNFKISEIQEGTYVLEISFMGFQTHKQTINISKNKNKINLGVIQLKEDVTQLEAVEIRAETTSIIHKIDKRVIVVGNDLLAAGSTAAEILDNLPSVDVDADGVISFRGNTNVTVFLDGKPTSISSENLLEQLPANAIKEIELISNPSARYNPEGIGGIINIILNKNANLGFNGNFLSGISFRMVEPSTNSSLNMNFKKGKINVFGNFGFSDRKRNREGFFNHEFNNTLNQYNTRNVVISKLIKFGVDFRINKKNVLSVYTHQNYLNTKRNYDSEVTNPLNTIRINTDYYFKNRLQIYNLNYKVEFDKPEHNLEFEINIDNSAIDQNNFNTDDSTTSNLTNFEDVVDVSRSFAILNLDYANTFDNGLALELGLESRIRRADNNRQTNQLGIEPESLFEYDRNEYSFYVTVSKKINDKFSYKLGSRFEYFEFASFLDENLVFGDDYRVWYPSVHLTYDKDKKNKFKIGYSKHVLRPGINQLNPTNLWNSYVMTLVGNPKLIPIFTDYFEFNYIRKFEKGTFNIVPYYQITRNWISQSVLQDPNDPNRLILSYENADKTYVYAFETFLDYKISKKWKINLGTFFSNTRHTGVIEGQDLAANINQFRLTLSQNFTITKKLRVSVLGKYYGKTRFLQITKEPFARIDIASRYRFLDNKANLSLKFGDIFDTMYQQFSSEIPYRFNGATTVDARNIYIGFSYNFGESKIKKRNRKRHEKQNMGNEGF